MTRFASMRGKVQSPPPFRNPGNIHARNRRSAFASDPVTFKFVPVPPVPSLPRFFPRALVAALFASLAGCVHEGTRLRRGEHEVQINATATAPVRPGTAFVVTPTARERGAESTLLFAEVARQVKGALMAKGLYEAPDSAHAAVIVEVQYSMETPRVPAATPGNPVPAAGQDPRAVAIDDPRARAAQRGALSKNLVLTAREAKPAGGGMPRTLWSVELSTTDESTDLRNYIPLLAASAIDEIGVDTGGPKTVRINESDKSVALVRKTP